MSDDVYIPAEQCGRLLIVKTHVYDWHPGQGRMICRGCGVTYLAVPLKNERCRFAAEASIFETMRRELIDNSPFILESSLRKQILDSVQHALVVDALEQYVTSDILPGYGRWRTLIAGDDLAHWEQAKKALESSLLRHGVLRDQESLRIVERDGRRFPYALVTRTAAGL